MEELYSIMRDLLEVEYNQKSLLFILEIVENAYNDEQQEDSKLITNHAKRYLKTLQCELRTAINRMDNYIAAEANPKKDNRQQH